MCSTLTNEISELKQQNDLLKDKINQLESSKEFTPSSCLNCIAMQTELENAKLAKSDSCASCISFKHDLVKSEECVARLTQENIYLQQSLERFSQGKKKLNMILDQSKVFKNNKA